MLFVKLHYFRRNVVNSIDFSNVSVRAFKVSFSTNMVGFA